MAEPKPAHVVFICHSSKDSVAANAARGWLERVKIPCWIAPRDVLPGIPYGQAIAEAIEKSRLVILVMSSNANESNHVMRELELAVNGSIPIIPLRIENVEPSKKLVYFIEAIHWLNAFTPPLAKHLEGLEMTVRTILAGRTAPETRSGYSAVPSAIPRRSPVASVAEGLPASHKTPLRQPAKVTRARVRPVRTVSVARPTGMSKLLCAFLALLVIGAAVFAGVWVVQHPPGSSAEAAANDVKSTPKTGKETLPKDVKPAPVIPQPKGVNPAPVVLRQKEVNAPPVVPQPRTVTIRIFDRLGTFQVKDDITIALNGVTKRIMLQQDAESGWAVFTVPNGRYSVSLQPVTTYRLAMDKEVSIEGRGSYTLDCQTDADFDLEIGDTSESPALLSLRRRNGNAG